MTDTLERVEDVEERPRRVRRRRSPLRTILVMTPIVALVLVATGVLPVQQYLERNNQVAAARERLDEIDTRNSEISADVDALSTDREIERVAREQYGFVREGEVGYSVVVPPETDLVATTPEPVATVDDAPGFFERIWRFVTGGDVVDDG
ncbi:MAG: septum formation initiator family protein [Acidimicrobiia bacterium]|nr:septum formation initiator family protein [Acidimicrobiia bacterium]